MSVEIKVPELPESIVDAVIANWYKSAGEPIAQDENLVDLETDKVVLEVPAINAGIVREIYYQTGDTVKAGDLLAVIDDSNDAISTPIDEITEETQAVRVASATSPSVRKLIAEFDLQPEQIHGTGKNGRILKQDVETYISTRKPQQQNEEKKGEQSRSNKDTVEISRQSVSSPEAFFSEASEKGDRLQRRVPMTRLRATIARRLVQAQQNAAILTTFNEVNMQPIMALRDRYKESFEKRFNVRLGFMSFFVQACVEALKRFPEINASVDDNDVVYHGFYDIGVAVSGANGLVVPVIRDADLLGIAQIEQAILDFASRAKNNALNIEEITGGTFTISNGGVFGSMLSTPILNPPQSAILGMHNIQQRAMVVDGEIVALPMMYLALSYDHRLIDGSSAVQFLVTVKQLLEDPSRMLLGL